MPEELICVLCKSPLSESKECIECIKASQKLEENMELMKKNYPSQFNRFKNIALPYLREEFWSLSWTGVILWIQQAVIILFALHVPSILNYILPQINRFCVRYISQMIPGTKRLLSSFFGITTISSITDGKNDGNVVVELLSFNRN